jgi:hypothetical protein
LLYTLQKHQQYIAKRGGIRKREVSAHGGGGEGEIDRTFAA